MKDKIELPHTKDVKIRKSFPGDFDPSTKIEKSKTDYKRSQKKSEIQKALEQAEEDDIDLDWY
jgi:hypothetical protein